ncbi:MAG: hypothetical protein J0G95_10785 [Rhizobiales bacterium]|nr:hypothetical protein [Hyphomicrobiales bacterium]
MGIILNSAAANNADWKTQFQFTDAGTGDLIDFSGAKIEIEVKDFDGCRRIEATTDNGKISIISAGIFELSVPESEMKSLCPASYRIGGVYSLDGETISLFTGALTVIDGVARL